VEEDEDKELDGEELVDTTTTGREETDLNGKRTEKEMDRRMKRRIPFLPPILMDDMG
jgi:hypothetical protein